MTANEAKEYLLANACCQLNKCENVLSHKV